MLNQFLMNADQYIRTNPWLTLAAVFGGGVLTSSNPCVLAMIPLIISYVAGQRELGIGFFRGLFFSSIFVLGLSITFAGLGAVSALAGRIYGNISDVWNWLVAAVCIFMGLHMVGLFRFNFPSIIKTQPKMKGIVGAFVIGLLFGFVSAPCAAPVLIVLLTYLAGSHASIPYGVILLLVYAFGHSVLILTAGASMGFARRILDSERFTRITEWMRRIAGIIIILIGFYFIYKGLK